MSAEKVLVTAAGPNMEPVLERYSLPTFERFADAHGYDIHVEQLGEDSSQRDEVAKRARWQKIETLRKVLEGGQHELVLWVDADILICRDDEDIADRIHPDAFQALPLESYPAENRVNPTTSVWALRGNEVSMEFLKAAQDIGMQPGMWADQRVVMELLGWELGEENYRWARPGIGTKYTPGTSILPEGWNQSYLATRTDPRYFTDRPVVRDPHAIHFHGMTVEERMVAMQSVCRELGYSDAEETGGQLVPPDKLKRPIPAAAFLKPALGESY